MLNGNNVIQTVVPSNQPSIGTGFELTANQNFTIIGIMKADGQGTPAPGQAHALSDSPSNTHISVGLGGGGSNNNLRLICRSNNGQLVNIDGGLFVAQGWKIVCWQFTWATKTGKLIVDGVVNTGTNALMDQWVFGGTDAYYLGANYNIAPFFYWVGYLGEFVEYGDLKSNADINQLGNYFANKYGLIWINI